MDREKLRLNAPRLPWLLADRLKRRAMMAYYRGIAIIGAESRVENDGAIINPSGDRARIQIGARTCIRGELFAANQGAGLTIGDDCFVGPETRIWAWNASRLVIGDRVLISHQVNIHDNDSHPKDAYLRHAQWQAIHKSGHPSYVREVETAPVSIGDDAWIGFGAAVLKGVTIGEGAIVGCMSLVTKNVAPWTIVVGFPAKPISDIGWAKTVRDQVAATLPRDHKAAMRASIQVVD